MSSPERRVARTGSRAALAVLLLTIGAIPAKVQSSPSDTGSGAPRQQHRHRGRQAGAQPPQASNAQAPVMHDIWPHLDSGAVLCKTPEGLTQGLR
jgi:hypothetical protein